VPPPPGGPTGPVAALPGAGGLVVAERGTTTDGGRTWRAMVPPPRPVRPQSLAVDPADARHLIALDGDQLYDSRDEGRTWRRSRASRLAFALPLLTYVAGGVLLASRFSADDVIFPQFRRSSDRARTWRGLALPAGGEASAVAAVGATRTVYAAVPTGGRPGLYRSADAGATWRRIALAGRRVRAVAVAQGRLTVAVAGREDFGPTRFLTSIDGGRSFRAAGRIAAGDVELEADATTGAVYALERDLSPAIWRVIAR